MKIELSIDFLFSGFDWASRIVKTSHAGIQGVEFGNSSTHDGQLAKKVLKDYGVEVVLLAASYWVDTPVPHLRYSVTNKQNHDAFVHEFNESLEFGRLCNARNILLDTGDSIAGLDDETMMKNCIEALGPAADKVVSNGMKPIIEPLNRDDHRGIFLHGIDQASYLARQVGSTTKILVDIFHSTKEEGNKLKDTLERNKQFLGEIIHVADVPDRHEPGTGIVDWGETMRVVKSVGFDGWVGFEFFPSRVSETSISNARNVLDI
ncbi:MAG: TIM barrel protein [Thaumarchaeota archaeon]|nr:TIM barrel protein [Nitrososphaerota archaeon]